LTRQSGYDLLLVVHCKHAVGPTVSEILEVAKDNRQWFLQKVSKKQFRTVYYNANACW